MRKWPLAIVLAMLGATALVVARWSPLLSRTHASQASRSGGPQYDAGGALLRPKDFETWVFVGASTGLSYEGARSAEGIGLFHNVYIRPESYEAYRTTGKFPEKTMFVLTLYDPAQKVAPSKAGYFEGEFRSMAVAVKDHEHFPEGWAYFAFGGARDMQESATAVSSSNCFSCHSQHAADDNVFVQFYPMLRSVKGSRQKAPDVSGR